jgi:outer membrane protein assembly factor BamB
VYYFSKESGSVPNGVETEQICVYDLKTKKTNYYDMKEGSVNLNNRGLSFLERRTSNLTIASGYIHKDHLYYVTWPFNKEESLFGRARTSSKRQNKIVCYFIGDARKKPKKLWSWPSSSAERHMVLNSFPVVIGDKLYISANILQGQINTEILCFQLSENNTKPPKMVWKTFINSKLLKGNNQTTDYLGSGITAAYGLLFFNSNLGVAAAVDQHTGEIKWINRYRDHHKRNYRLVNVRKWQNNHCYKVPPIIRHGKLYTTATDTNKMYIYDAFNGELETVFPDTKENSDYQQIVHVDDYGKVLLAGKQKIVCIAPQGSKEIQWQLNIKGRHKFRGMAVATANKMYISSNYGMYQVDLSSGAKKRLAIRQLPMNTNSVTFFRWKDTSYLFAIGSSEATIYKVRP